MKTLYILVFCFFISSCKQQPGQETAGNGTPQYIEDTTSKIYTVPSTIQLPEADRFKKEQFDTLDEGSSVYAERILESEHYKISIAYPKDGNMYSILIDDILTNKAELWTFYLNGQPKTVSFSTKDAPCNLFIRRQGQRNGESIVIPAYEVWEGCYQNGELTGGTRFGYYDSYIGVAKYYNTNGHLDSIVDYDKLYPVPYSKALEIAKANGFSMPGLGVSRQLVKGRTVWEIIKFDALKEEEFTENEMGSKILLIDALTGKISKPDYIVRCSHVSNIEKG